MCFSYCKYMYMGANDPQGGAIFDPRGMIGRIYAEHQIASFLIFKLRVLWFPRRFFHVFSYYKPTADIHASWPWPIWTPGA